MNSPIISWLKVRHNTEINLNNSHHKVCDMVICSVKDFKITFCDLHFLDLYFMSQCPLFVPFFV